MGEIEYPVPFRVGGLKEALCEQRTKQVGVGVLTVSSLLSRTPSVCIWDGPPSLKGLKAMNA